MHPSYCFMHYKMITTLPLRADSNAIMKPCLKTPCTHLNDITFHINTNTYVTTLARGSLSTQ